MSFTDESLPLDDAAETVDLPDDELDTGDADEEMSGALEEESDDDEESSLDDDDEDELDAETLEDDDPRAARLAELEAQVRRTEYERQQAANQDYWTGIEKQAQDAFAWEEAQIWANKDNYVDPDAFVRQEFGRLQARTTDWYNRFYASQNESRRQQYEKAAIPTYAARVATHYDLSPRQAKSLLDYRPDDMQREATKMARHNAEKKALKAKLTQSSRKNAQTALMGKNVNSGSTGRTPAGGAKRGSDAHLKQLFASAG